MKNIIILGAGRSGTSMIAGALAGAGYYLGESLLPPTPGNPKGYYESREVEAINDALVMAMLKPRRRERWLAPLRPIPRQPDFAALRPWARAGWLALIPLARRPVLKPRHREAVAALVAHQPFCFKDPRFAYTLPAWRPLLDPATTLYVCAFRAPALTAVSILKEVESEDYLRGLRLTHADALNVWRYSYAHILRRHRYQGQWLFLHYDQVIAGDGLARLEAASGATLDRHFPEAALSRAQSNTPVPRALARMYARLCALAGYRPGSEAG